MNLHWQQDDPSTPGVGTPSDGGGIGADEGSPAPQRFAGDVPISGKDTDTSGPARTREEVFRREHEAIVRGSAEIQEVKSRERATRAFIESEVERLAPRKAAIEKAKADRASAAAQKKSEASERSSAFREEQKALEEERKAREAQRRADEEKRIELRREEIQKRKEAQRDGGGLTVQQKAAQVRVAHQATQYISKAREDVKNRVHNLDRVISISDSRRKEIAGQLKELQRETSQAERTIQKEEKDIERLRLELRDIQAERREIMTETGKKTRADITKEVAQLDRQRFKLENEIRTLEHHISRDSRVDQRSSAEINTLKRELRDLEGKLPRLELEYRELSDLMREIERARFSKDPVAALQKLNYELEKQGIHLPGAQNIRPAA